MKIIEKSCHNCEHWIHSLFDPHKGECEIDNMMRYKYVSCLYLSEFKPKEKDD